MLVATGGGGDGGDGTNTPPLSSEAPTWTMAEAIDPPSFASQKLSEYVEPIAVGEALPDMPIFLKPDFYVPAPLEESYRTTWDDFFPAPMKGLLEAPNADAPETTRPHP